MLARYMVLISHRKNKETVHQGVHIVVFMFSMLTNCRGRGGFESLIKGGAVNLLKTHSKQGGGEGSDILLLGSHK